MKPVHRPQGGGAQPRPLKERFDEKWILDERTGCWLWNAGLTTYGYGKIRGEDGRARDAHIVAWELYVGPVPKGMCVLHACDHLHEGIVGRRCVRPREGHLWLGTKAENSDDMRLKGRSTWKGETTEEQRAKERERGRLRRAQ